MVLGVLDALDSSWSFKVSVLEDGLKRPDSVVIYANSGADTQSALAAVQSLPNSFFVESTPGFSRRVAKGVALGASAGDRGHGSFGAQVSNEAALALLAGRDLRDALRPFVTKVLEI